MCNYVELEENKKEIRGAEPRWRWGSTCRPCPHHYSLRRFRSAGVLSTPLRSPPCRRYLHLLVSTTSLSSSSRSPPRCYSLHSSLSLPSIAVLHLSLVFSASSPSSPLRRRVFHVIVVPIHWDSPRRWCSPHRWCSMLIVAMDFSVLSSNAQSSHLRAFQHVGVGFSVPSCWWASCRFRSCPHRLGWLSSFAGVLHIVIVSLLLVFCVVVHRHHRVFCPVTAPHCSLSCCPVGCPLCWGRIALVVVGVVE